MTSRDWSVESQTLILPPGAGPDDPAIIEGGELPPCMQPTYASAIFFRPPNSRALPGPPYWFLAQQKTLGPTLQIVDEGYLIWDVATICGFVVVRRRTASNALAGPLFVNEMFGEIDQGGVATFSDPPVMTFDRSKVIIGPIGQDPNLTPYQVDGFSAVRGIRTVQTCAPAGSVTMATSAGAEATVAAGTWTNPGGQPSFTFQPNRIMEIGLKVSVFSSVAGQRAKLRIRKGPGGTNLMTEYVSPVLGAGAVESHLFVGYMQNLTAAPIVTTLDLSIERILGAGNVNLFAEVVADSVLPCIITSTDVTDTNNIGLNNAAKSV